MIRILPESIILSIAAGEVIERPSSVVKELLENAIDAGASKIDLEIEEGGIKKIAIKDNGCGMSPEDIDLCLLPHSTSKIKSKEDLMAIKTLGFRGEALASISACSRISIKSTQKKDSGYYIQAENSKILTQRRVPLSQIGTAVEVEDLFFYLSSRRRFLKKPYIEFMHIKGLFEDIALSHPHINLKLIKDKRLESIYSATSPKERFHQVWANFFNMKDVVEFRDEIEHLSYQFIASKPHISRNDKKCIKVFVNGRRIEDTSLTQIVVKSYESIIPSGSFPYATLHLNINPEMVDFNIHPCKKEVRFLHLSHLGSFLVKSLRGFLTDNFSQVIPSFGEEDGETLNKRESDIEKDNNISGKFLVSSEKNLELEDKNLNSLEFNEYPEFYNPLNNPLYNKETNEIDFDYLGQFSKQWLLVELKDRLIVIDQHAAHERILFEEFKKNSYMTEKLLFPYPFAIESTPLTLEQIEQYKSLGIIINLVHENIGSPIWEYEITELPKPCLSMELSIVDFLKDRDNYIVTDLFFKLYSNLACRKAVKRGDVLEYQKAWGIAATIFHNKWFTCPHGRPLWLEFKKRYFDDLIKRT